VRIVAKIGTSSVTDEVGVIDRSAVASVAAQTARLRELGHEVLVVTSGAVSAGVSALALESRPADVPTLQALAAAGMPHLMYEYNEAFRPFGLVAAQVLVVPHDFVNRRQYLHARQTIGRLLELGAVPVVNENDALAADEIRFGDNDRIAALLAQLVSADLLVMLTDTPGLFSADPRVDPSARLVRRVPADDPMLGIQAGRSGSNRGSGGMGSKLNAARIASWSGVRAVIAQASRPNVLVDAACGTLDVGTEFEPHVRRLPARKLWIAFASAIDGRLVVDDGARRALEERSVSLLPAGVVAVEGEFVADDIVEIADRAGTVFARGMVAEDAATARRMAGRRTAELPPEINHELIHRDDLVLVPANGASR
jgi:glutamate 5-kinase